MKRWISLILSAVLLLTLAACGGAGTADPDAGLAGAEEYRGELPFVKHGEEPITITIGINTNGNVTDYENNEFTNWLEEQTGLKLDFVQFSGKAAENATQVALMMASGEKLPDILHPGGITKRQADEYGQDGYFIDLKPYFEKYGYYFNKAFEDRYAGDTTLRDRLLLCASAPGGGKLYNFPTLDDIPGDTAVCHGWINQVWLDRLGLEMPRTLSQLHDVLVAFRDRDPNGNGKKDEIPMIGVAENGHADVTRYIVNAFVYWNPKYHFNVDEAGKLWSPYTTDEYRQALIYMSDLVKEGLLSTLTWTQTSSENKGLFNPAEDGDELCGVIGGHPSLVLNAGARTLFDYEPLPPFKAETKLGGYGARNAPVLYYTIYVTSDCAHPVEAFKLLDFMCSDEASIRAKYGTPGVNWEYLNDGSRTETGGFLVRLLGDSVWNTQNNVNWHNPWIIDKTGYFQFEQSEQAWENTREEKNEKNLANYLEAGQPEKLFTDVAYSKEEDERLTEIKKELTDYLKDRRAQFCTGTLDPRDDAQWQTYLDGLEALHFSEWLEISQAAYDRMPKN